MLGLDERGRERASKGAAGAVGPLLIAASLTFALPARSDAGIEVWLYSLVQDGQDVQLMLEFWDRYSDPPWTLSLVRENDSDEETVVLDEELFDAEGAFWISEPVCDEGSSPECLETPEFCTDCDGDDIPECGLDGFCVSYYRYSLVDECVPPGYWEYWLSLGDYEVITVTDSGDECLEDDPTDAGTDADSDADADDEDSVDDGCGGTDGPVSLGCSVAASGVSHLAGAPLAFVLLVIGLVALRAHRRR